MYFRRISVANFRKLIVPVVIDELDDAVTIIAGDNEEGKSTLLSAIRAGLFERHNLGGKAVEAMQPFGSSVRPEITLDFEIDGKNYSIAKGFAQKPSARLVTPQGVFEGPAAEERLAELLTFRVSQRGESKPDDQGVLGLFWLEQGRGLEGLSMGETGRATLRGSLVQEVGDILGGTRGRNLLQAARGKRDGLLTAKGKPRGDLATAIEDATVAAELAARLEQERKDYDEEIDTLAQVRRDLSQIVADGVMEKALQALENAQMQAGAIQVLRQNNESAAQAVRLAIAQRLNAQDRADARQALTASLKSLETAMESTEETCSRLLFEGSSVAEAADEANRNLAEAIDATHAAEEHVLQAETQARRTQLDREINELDRRLSETIKESERERAEQAKVRACKVDQMVLDRLRKLEMAVLEARVALGAVATRIRFLPTANQAVTIVGQQVPAGETIHLTAATQFALEGFGGLEVEPSASDLTDRQLSLREAETGLEKALRANGVSDLAAAQTALLGRNSAAAEASEAARLVAALAPDGLDTLKALLGEKKGEREQLESGPVVGATNSPEAERRALSVKKSAEAAARGTLEKRRNEQSAHGIQLARAEQAVQNAKAGFLKSKSGLEKARAERGDEQLSDNLKSAQEDVTAAEQRQSKTNAELSAANPTEAELRLGRTKAALQSVDTEQRRLRDSEISLESRLSGLGKSGVGELLDAANGEARQISERRDRLLADAQAWDLLVETLSSAEREAKEAFLEPVLKRVDPFLRLLFPDARVALHEETLEIMGVERDGHNEPYDSLSVGTREQLSILVRLAFAVYLREKGVPAAVILDDALVYADDDRFERMQLALRKAAESVQIIILTCRARDWRQFGAPIRRLSTARNKGEAS